MIFMNKLYEIYMYIIRYLLYFLVQLLGFNTGKSDMPDDDDIYGPIDFEDKPGFSI